MLSEWKNIKLDMEPNIRVVPKVEIDESKIISNLEKVYNLFGIIDRNNKNAHVFCFLDNTSRETLL